MPPIPGLSGFTPVEYCKVRLSLMNLSGPSARNRSHCFILAATLATVWSVLGQCYIAMRRYGGSGQVGIRRVIQAHNIRWSNAIGYGY